MKTRPSIILWLFCLMAGLYGCGGGAASTSGSAGPTSPNPGQAASITLTSSARIIHTGNAIPLTARALDAAGNGVSGVAVVFTSTGVGTMNTNYQLTDSNGNASANIFSTATGGSTVNAFSNTLASSLNVYFVSGAIQNTLTVSIDSNGNNIFNEPADFDVSTNSGALSKIRVTYLDAGGAPLTNKTITLASDSPIVTFTSSSHTTDNNGNAYTFASFNNTSTTTLQNTIFVDITASAPDGTVGTIAVEVQPFIVGSIQFYADNYSPATGGTAKLTACLVSSTGSPIQIANLGINFAVSPATSGTLLPFSFTDATGCTTDTFTAITAGTDTLTASFTGVTANLTLNVGQASHALLVTPSTASANAGDTVLFMITGGTAPYTVTSLTPSLTNPATWNVAASGGTFSVTAVKAGTATMLITDSTGTQIQATLTITGSGTQSSLAATPSTASLVVGEPQIVVITGGIAPYTVTSLNPSLTSPATWNVAHSGGTFQVSGTAAGTALINIADSTGAQIQVTLNITAASGGGGGQSSALTATPASVSVIVGQPQVVVVTGGTAPYTATSLSPSLTNPTSWSVATSGGSFQVTGINPGAALINIVDHAGVQIQMTLNISTTNATSLTATPASVSLKIGEPQIVVITGGAAPYTITSLNPSLTDSPSWSVTSSGGSFQVTPVAAGTALLNVVDNNGTQIQVTLNIS